MSAKKEAQHNQQLLSICSTQGEAMSSAIAAEAQSIVREAAGNAQGLTVKGQIRQAARNLGYAADSWRIREAWYGGAGAWSAAAIRKLQVEYLRWRERETVRAANDEIIRAQRDRELLERHRDECEDTLADLNRQLALLDRILSLPDPRLDR